MNTKFFDLHKEKQDRIINGSLKIICRYGYRHASTDEIVAEAGISKGLLFHYFISKKGLVRFLYDYSAHYVLDELRRCPLSSAEDYMGVQELLLRMEAGIMEIYPCMLLFLRQADGSDDPEVREALEDLPLLGAVASRYEQALASAPRPEGGRSVLTEEDLPRMTSLLTYMRTGIVRDMLRTEDPRSSVYLSECTASLNMLRRLNET